MLLILTVVCFVPVNLLLNIDTSKHFVSRFSDTQNFKGSTICFMKYIGFINSTKSNPGNPS